MGLLAGATDPQLRAFLEEFLARFRGQHSDGIVVGEQWRVVEGQWPDGNSPNCVLLQHKEGTEWRTFAGFKPDGSDMRGCFANYGRTTAQTITHGAANVMDYNVRYADTDNAVTTGATWNFKTPSGKGGLYHVSAFLNMIYSGTDTEYTGLIEILRDGNPALRGNRISQTISVNGIISFHVQGILNLAVGSTVQITMFQVNNNLVSRDTEAAAQTNGVSIMRIPFAPVL